LITGDGSFTTHNPIGMTLYGADLGVDPVARNLGIGTLFYETRKELIRERGLKRLLTGGRIAGYAAVADQMTAKEYVAEVVDGKRKDPALSFQLENDLVVSGRGSRLHARHGILRICDGAGMAEPGIHFVGQPAGKSATCGAGAGCGRVDAWHSPTRRVRIAAVQYLLRPIASFDDFVHQVEFFVRSAKDYKAHFLLFPEFFTMQLLSYIKEPAPAMAVRRLARMAPEYEALFTRLAKETGIYIIGGTHPVFQRGKVFNAAHLFHAEWTGIPAEEGPPNSHRERTLPAQPRTWAVSLPHRLRQYRDPDLLRRRVS
jgi:hypothetical protein